MNSAAMPPTRRGEHIAVVGSGVAGLTAAYLLSRQHEVTLFEAEPRLGGHAHTHEVPVSMSDRPEPSGTIPVDTGFIVHNDRTYPMLTRLFAELGVQTRPTEMSMSVHSERTGMEYAGGRGVASSLSHASWATPPTCGCWPR